MNEKKYPPLSKEDFNDINWEDLISECGIFELPLSFVNFAQVREEYAEKGKLGKAHAFDLLSGIVSLCLTKSVDNPFVRFEIKHFPSTALITPLHGPELLDFPIEDLKILAEVIRTISNHEMRARIADVLWVRLEKSEYAVLAIDAYLKSADIQDERMDWNPVIVRTTRAQNIAQKLSDEDQIRKVKKYISELITNNSNKPSTFIEEMKKLLDA